MKGRGSSIAVPDHWLEECRGWTQANEETTRSLGPKLAEVLQRPRPFSKATVARYLRGENVTDELTKAFSMLMGVPFPMPLPKNADQRRWFELGSELDELDHDLFLEELEHVAGVVDASRALVSLRANRPKPHKE